ncbi:MAG: hypothetical protein K2Q09_01700, partial [Phycisphaerales bacterium]|nr:hypothetical protein [Phycisphaerales bacterium]
MDTHLPNYPSTSRTALVNGRRVYLVRIARIQRTLIWLTLGLLGCYAGLGGGVAVLRQLNAPPTAAKALLAGAGT